MSRLNPSACPALPSQPGQTPGITERIRGEFREMPGLRLTLSQAGRLWSLDAATCSDALAHLVDAGFLARRGDGAFCRASDLAASIRIARAALELDVDRPRRLARA